jgi:hypothetical protein
MPIIDFYSIGVHVDLDGSAEPHLALWCGECDRQVVSLTSGQLLPDIIEEAQGHLSLHHREPNGTR